MLERTQRILINEVGPRDGFQNYSIFIPTETKAKIVSKLIECGFNKLEITSFVSQEKVSQMRDAERLIELVQEKADISNTTLCALVPNLKGAERASQCGINDISVIISVSEMHNEKNTGMTIKESLNEIRKIREAFPELSMNFSVCTSFGCHFQGKIQKEDVVALINKLIEIRPDIITISDTVGHANPCQVDEMVTLLKKEFPETRIGLHFHDAFGMGLTNVLVAINRGFYEFDSSLGGMGGCPFSPGAMGNIVTEDLVMMLKTMGIECNTDIEKLKAAVKLLKESVQFPLKSHVADYFYSDNEYLVSRMRI